jgi:hypothetical protein
MLFGFPLIEFRPNRISRLGDVMFSRESLEMDD